ncbi:hypothetical protein CR203_18610 [Salipaludibacillus neizhouensis]|uniref:SnoaL-like domain-containing protein n=1 Tax=Salipaludibacillus neizhouensis TaxID=885475 RepID=A0A3A9JY93_9BACI|nr:hypothetical protein [Salipaludibacillus neizhouensis]RKL65864.1 hypothetical protein CR203_18610 [Salipaludibacillus neizhouensis]
MPEGLHPIISKFMEMLNLHNTEGYEETFSKDAVINEISVGRNYEGKEEIKEYFTNYFIGYNTQTKLVSHTNENYDKVNVRVFFTGDFPGGEIYGSFKFILHDGYITYLEADLE